jgi:hypothetical protein
LQHLARKLLADLSQREEWLSVSADDQGFALRYAAALLEDHARPVNPWGSCMQLNTEDPDIAQRSESEAGDRPRVVCR